MVSKRGKRKVEGGRVRGRERERERIEGKKNVKW